MYRAGTRLFPNEDSLWVVKELGLPTISPNGQAESRDLGAPSGGLEATGGGAGRRGTKKSGANFRSVPVQKTHWQRRKGQKPNRFTASGQFHRKDREKGVSRLVVKLKAPREGLNPRATSAVPLRALAGG